MQNKLFVGNISWDADDEALKELFSAYGEVTSAHVATDKFSGRSRGFGFVEMSSDEEAQKAIETLDGSDWMERPLTVNVAKPRE